MKRSLALTVFLLFTASLFAADAAPATPHKRSKAHTDYRTYQAKDWEEQYQKRQAEEEAVQKKTHDTMKSGEKEMEKEEHNTKPAH